MPFPPSGPPEAAASAERNASPLAANSFEKAPQKADSNIVKGSETRNPFLVILTTEQARAIYTLRSTATAQGPEAQQVAGKSSLVAELFHVSPKTIRDVVSSRTLHLLPACNIVFFLVFCIHVI